MGNSLVRAVVSAVFSISCLIPVTVLQAADDDLAAGGRLYDKFWKQARSLEPKSTHPSYPKAGKQSGSATWRCKECHGWDYQGKDGAYATGSHYTGIKGIRGMAGKTVGQIEKVLRNPAHGYDKVMSPNRLAQVARFVANGQVDMDRFIDRKTKKAKGNSTRGRKLYADNCAECHGDDGREYNFKEKSGGEEYLGTIANKNPWETLHKLVNGQPGESDGGKMGMHSERMGSGMRNGMHGGGMMDSMPAMRTRVKAAAWGDLLAYLQTLPK